MTIIVNGSSINLTKHDFLAAGGEGSVYAKGNTAYKIYKQPSRSMPKQKIVELSVLKDDKIIRPLDIAYDTTGTMVGYCMRYLPKGSTFVLCELFNKPFKDRNNLSALQLMDLITTFRSQVSYCHSNSILIVDLNEMNFLISKDFKDVFFIDTDSYQTPSYPATAIMESIEDVHAKKFTTDSDWFSFGILTFNLLTGINPFKGTHASYKTMAERKMNNISVLNASVSYPPFVKAAIKQLPNIYMDWYKEVFENGKRMPFPVDLKNAIIVMSAPAQHVVTSGIIETEWFNDDLAVVVRFYNKDLVLTKTYLQVNGKKDVNVAPYSHIKYCARSNSYVSFTASRGKLKAYDITRGVMLDSDIEAYNIISYGNNVYIEQSDYISEIDLLPSDNSMLVCLSAVAQISSKSTICLDGFAIQNLLGSYFLSLFPKSTLHYSIRVPELDDYRILDGKFERQVCMIVGEKNGKKTRFIIKFNKDFDKYVIREVADSDIINFTCLPTGVVVSVNDDYNLELFTISLTDNNLKVVKDTDFSNKVLGSIDNNVYYCEDGRVFSIKMK